MKDTLEDSRPPTVAGVAHRARTAAGELVVATSSNSKRIDDAATLVDEHPPIDAPRRATGTTGQSVQLSGAEAEAARALAEEDAPSDLARTLVAIRRAPAQSCECRLCGERVTAPRPARWRPAAPDGVRCERCRNVYCSQHVVRVSSLVETLLRGARHRCPLCLG